MTDQNNGREVFAKGWTSTIYAGGNIDRDNVVKAIDRDHGSEKKAKSQVEVEEYLQAIFDTERRVYERISAQPSQPDSLLHYYGIDTLSRRGLILERAEGGCVADHLHVLRRRLPEKPEAVVLWKWARQATEALAFVHTLGILHCDIHCANFFLDGKDNLRLADFGAASIDGSRPRLMYRASHQLWVQGNSGVWRKDVSVAAEIFAFGCALYNLEAMLEPFQKLMGASDREGIVQRLRDRQMPDTDGFVMDLVIQKCWKSKYRTMDDVLQDILTASAAPA